MVAKESSKDMLADGVFKNLVMRAVVDKQPDEGSDTADFLEQLKELSNLHFKAITPTPAAAPPTPETQAAAELATVFKPAAEPEAESRSTA